MYEALGEIYKVIADVYAEIGAGMSMNVQQAAADPELAGEKMNVAYFLLTGMPLWRHLHEIAAAYADYIATLADAMRSV